MTGQDAFLTAIVDEPENIALRLMYADWLLERDDPRGEFIQVQIEVERLADAHSPRASPRLQLINREAELLHAHDLKWFEELEWHEDWRAIRDVHLADGATHHGGWTDWGAVYAGFRRGFVECVSLTAADFLSYGPALVRATPLTQVVLTDRKPQRWANDGWWFGDRISNVHMNDVWLESALWDMLTPPMSVSGHKHYPSEAEALADLSAACLKWARAMNLANKIKPTPLPLRKEDFIFPQRPL